MEKDELEKVRIRLHTVQYNNEEEGIGTCPGNKATVMATGRMRWFSHI